MRGRVAQRRKWGRENRGRGGGGGVGGGMREGVG